jgi:hypothetical protein
MTTWRVWVAAGAVLLGACAAQGAEFTSPQGFSLSYPDGWAAMSKDQTSEARKKIQSHFKEVREADLVQVAVMIGEENAKGFAANANVTVGQGRDPYLEKTEAELRQFIAEQYGKVGLAPYDIQVEKIKVGDMDVVSSRFSLKMPAVNEPIRQWQVTVPGPRRTYILTCTSLEADQAKYQPVFAAIVSSFRVTPDPWWQDLLDSGAFRYGVIGGLVGGVVVWLKLRRRRGA